MGVFYCGKCGGRVENGFCTQCGAQMPELPVDNEQPQNVEVQPQYSDAQPQNVDAQPQYSDAQPQYSDAQPQYSDAQPQYAGAQPQYSAAQPQYGEAQPQYAEAQPQYAEAQPQYAGAQPQYGDAQPQYAGAQPQYADAQPQYGDAQPQYAGAQPQYGEAQPQYAGAQPQYAGAQPQYGAAQPQYGAVQQQYGNQANGLVEPDEQVIATIGNSYAENFFTSGFLGMGGAMLTNKRFYYTGKAISVGSAMLRKTKCVVELSEVTGVEIVHKDKLGISIFMAILWQFLAIGCFFTANNGSSSWTGIGIMLEFFVLIAIVIGILSIKNMLCVVFKGGSVTFPIKLYGFAQCNEFLRQTLLARKAYIDQNK